MNNRGTRRGSIAALIVGVTIVVLYVVLQPGGKPRRDATGAATTSSTVGVATTRDPTEQLCDLARRFADDAVDQDPNVNARLAETFYSEARSLVGVEIRAEYEAAARYFTEYNNIGEPYDYDEERIREAGEGERWTQLQQRPPLGVDEARASVLELCQVDLPPPPTITTTTTTVRRTTTSETLPAPSTAAPATTAA